MWHKRILTYLILLFTHPLFFASNACLANKDSTINAIVVNTWNFNSAGEAAWDILKHPDASAIDAVQGRCYDRFDNNDFKKIKTKLIVSRYNTISFVII